MKQQSLQGELSTEQKKKLSDMTKGEFFDSLFDRGRYATDASFYQIMPKAVSVPKDEDDIESVLNFSREEGVAITPRGGGTSQSGQTMNDSIVMDCSKHFNKLLSVDKEARTCRVQPGIVLDELNRQLKETGLFFPVDVSTASRATIGGMAGNNSCGSRSLRYGIMGDNVLSMNVIKPNGSKSIWQREASTSELQKRLVALGAREANEIEARFPKVQRRVGGYNLDALLPGSDRFDFHKVLLGSEGTLAFTTELELKLWPQPTNKVLGVCHFPSFYAAMDAAQHLVKLAPVAVELVDDTMIALARAIPMFKPVIDQFVRGNPAAVLLVEFAEDDQAENVRRLEELTATMATLGFEWSSEPEKIGGVVKITNPAEQKKLWSVRAQGLNIMMSMKEEGKPVSFVEDCAVELKDLAEYTSRLTDVFTKHGTKGTWYAHASEGTLHVRPVLNLKLEQDVKTMRAIAEEAFEMVRAYKGAHSGEHGDGLVRSEFHEFMYGSQLVRAFEEVKGFFDPENRFNPGKIVNAPKMDDRSLFRYSPSYKVPEIKTIFDWAEYPGSGGGFQGAVEMCNNNGACRALEGGVMCPSYRVTRNERDVTRGRANSLRLAISGQLGSDALASPEMAETMQLCVGCKACKRECPTSVDMAKMKIEAQTAFVAKNGLSMHERLIAFLPRYAPKLTTVAPLINWLSDLAAVKSLNQSFSGLSKERSLPKWSSRPFATGMSFGPKDGTPIVLFADTFNTYQEPENLEAASQVLAKLGCHVVVPEPIDKRRNLCCGKTFLASGLPEQARSEAERLVATYLPYLETGHTVVGLEPSCTLALIDEVPSLLKTEASKQLAANVRLFAEIVDELLTDDNKRKLLASVGSETALVHGHCHEKAFAKADKTLAVLSKIPDLTSEMIESSCCGMAGAFGYHKDTIEASKAMGELSLLPKVRESSDTTIIVANGTSCRHQIEDGTERTAVHLAHLLARSLNQVR